MSLSEKATDGYWILIPGKPCSLKAKTKHAKARRNRYISRIKSTASEVINRPFNSRAKVEIYHFHKGTNIDIDNIQKVILDSLKNVAYKDDNQVDDLHSRRINLNTPYTIENVTSRIILEALANGKECVVIKIQPLK